jgi:hypothetical protein
MGGDLETCNSVGGGDNRSPDEGSSLRQCPTLSPWWCLGRHGLVIGGYSNLECRCTPGSPIGKVESRELGFLHRRGGYRVDPN